jgi:hypothetical protein
MSIKYDKYDLLWLFECEPKVLKEGMEIFLYKQEDSRGFSLEFYIDVCEETCIITLMHKDLVKPLYNITINKVISITGREDRLIIRRTMQEKGRHKITRFEQHVILYFKPNYELRIENQKDEEVIA